MMVVSVPRCFPIRDCNFRLGSVQHLLELGHAVAHPGVHVCFGALDVVMKVVTEKLDVTDRCGRNFGVDEVTRE